MKKTRHLFAVLCMLLFCGTAAAQNTPQGAPTQLTRQLGWYQVDSGLVIPTRDTVGWTYYNSVARLRGRFTVRPQDGKPYYHNGTSWQPVTIGTPVVIDSSLYVTVSRLNDTAAALRAAITAQPVPTLDQVTDAGNTTTNNITVNDILANVVNASTRLSSPLTQGNTLRVENAINFGATNIVATSHTLGENYTVLAPRKDGTLAVTSDITDSLNNRAWVNGGNSFTGSPTIGTNGNVNVGFEQNNVVRMTLSGTTLALGVTLTNSTSGNNATINPGAAGTVISRNVADANNALTVNLNNASSTGNVIQANNNVGRLFAVSQQGYISAKKQSLSSPTTVAVWDNDTLKSATFPAATIYGAGNGVVLNTGASPNKFELGGEYDKNTLTYLKNFNVYYRDTARYYNENAEDTTSILYDQGYRVPVPYGAGYDQGQSGLYTRVITRYTSGLADSSLDLWNASNGARYSAFVWGAGGSLSSFSRDIGGVIMGSATATGQQSYVSSYSGVASVVGNFPDGTLVALRVNADTVLGGATVFEDFRPHRSGIRYFNPRREDWQPTTLTDKFYVDSVHAGTMHVESSPDGLTMIAGHDYAFTGSASTLDGWFLPAIAGVTPGRGQMITIKNRGTGTLVITADLGNGEIWQNNATEQISLAVGASIILMPDGSYWLTE